MRNFYLILKLKENTTQQVYLSPFQWYFCRISEVWGPPPPRGWAPPELAFHGRRRALLSIWGQKARPAALATPTPSYHCFEIQKSFKLELAGPNLEKNVFLFEGLLGPLPWVSKLECVWVCVCMCVHVCTWMCVCVCVSIWEVHHSGSFSPPPPIHCHSDADTCALWGCVIYRM